MRPTIHIHPLVVLAAASMALTRPIPAVQCAGGSTELLSQAPDRNDGFLSDDSTDAFGQPSSNAEDFVLRQGMRLTGLRVWGYYWPSGDAVTDNFTVIVHTDDGGNVGPLVRRENGVHSTRSATGAQVAGLDEYEYVLQFAHPLSLPPGTYWIEVFNRTGDGDEDWLWETGTVDGTNGRPGHRVDGNDAPGRGWTSSPWDLALSVCGVPVDPVPSFVTQYPDGPSSGSSDASCQSCTAGVLVRADDFSLDERIELQDILVFGTYGPGASFYEDRFTLLLHEENSSGEPGDVVYVEQSTRSERYRLRTDVGASDVFRYVLTPSAPIVLEPGRYWLQVYNDTHSSNLDWDWMMTDHDPDNGARFSLLAFEAPGHDWAMLAQDLAFEVRGRLVDPPTLLVQQPSDFREGHTSDENCLPCNDDDHASAENVVFTETVTIEDILYAGFYATVGRPGDRTFTLAVHRDLGGTSRGDGLLRTDIHVNRATTDQDAITYAEFLYHLVPQAPIQLGPGAYWFEIFNDTADNNDTWFWTSGTADATHGIHGSADSEQAPGSVWRAQADDLNLVLRGSTGLGELNCTANTNSTGAPASIDAIGSASVSAGDLTLHSTPVPNQASVFFHGTNQIQLPFGDGFLCTSGDVRRGRVVHASGGTASYTYDNSHPRRSLTGLEGTTRNFQHWFRDPMGGQRGLQ